MEIPIKNAIGETRELLLGQQHLDLPNPQIRRYPSSYLQATESSPS